MPGTALSTRVINGSSRSSEKLVVPVASPFPVTVDGNKYIMVVSDYFNK